MNSVHSLGKVRNISCMFWATTWNSGGFVSVICLNMKSLSGGLLQYYYKYFCRQGFNSTGLAKNGRLNRVSCDSWIAWKAPSAAFQEQSLALYICKIWHDPARTLIESWRSLGVWKDMWQEYKEIPCVFLINIYSFLLWNSYEIRKER